MRCNIYKAIDCDVLSTHLWHHLVSLCLCLLGAKLLVHNHSHHQRGMSTIAILLGWFTCRSPAWLIANEESQTQYTTPGATGHCINTPLFFFANGIWAMLVDVCILCVPLPIS
jgi:hypothetical protein